MDLVLKVIRKKPRLKRPQLNLILKPKIKVNFIFTGDGTKRNTAIQTYSLKGDDYDFTLYDVAAEDRQTPWDAGVYLNPGSITIPQTVARIGYYFHDHWNLSVGVDHMKYVMVTQQRATIDGYIDLRRSTLRI